MAQSGWDYAKKFVTYFYQHICNGNVDDIELMYTRTFKALSDDHFTAKPWPRSQDLRSYVKDDLFWLMYQEMYYRHLHSLKKTDVTLEHRKDSWENYSKLFEILQNQTTTMKLPNIWLWDMIDEFLYQFGSFSLLKGFVSERTSSELQFLSKNPDVWDPRKVQSILESFIKNSGIRAIISEDGGQKLFETDGFVSDSNVLTMLGYFSLIGLSRLMCLLGQYEESLRVLAPLNPFNRTFLYTFKVPMANINIYYYSGTSYLMLHRYIDSARCFNTILAFIYRVKEQQRDTSAHQLILQKNEQIYHLLAITNAMCPSTSRWLEESVRDQLHHKCAEILSEMQSGQMHTFRKAFTYGCPKFITSLPPNLTEAGEDNNLAGYHDALRLIMSEAEATHQLPDLKKMLKLYTSISLSKLAGLLSTDVATLRHVLSSMRQRIMQTRWVSGDAASGEEAPATDIEFTLETDRETGEDIVVIREQRIPPNHLATLAKHIVRFEQITVDMDAHSQQQHSAASQAVAAR